MHSLILNNLKIRKIYQMKKLNQDESNIAIDYIMNTKLFILTKVREKKKNKENN